MSRPIKGAPREVDHVRAENMKLRAEADSAYRRGFKAGQESLVDGLPEDVRKEFFRRLEHALQHLSRYLKIQADSRKWAEERKMGR